MNNAIEKWARDVKGCFTEKGIQMPLPDVILCSNLFIWEKQIRTILRSDWQKSKCVTTSLRGCEADGYCQALPVEMQHGTISMEGNLAIHDKGTYAYSLESSKFLGSSPKDTLANTRKDICTMMEKLYNKNGGVLNKCSIFVYDNKKTEG